MYWIKQNMTTIEMWVVIAASVIGIIAAWVDLWKETKNERKKMDRR